MKLTFSSELSKLSDYKEMNEKSCWVQHHKRSAANEPFHSYVETSTMWITVYFQSASGPL